jgi:hypothetical protein
VLVRRPLDKSALGVPKGNRNRASGGLSYQLASQRAKMLRGFSLESLTSGLPNGVERHMGNKASQKITKQYQLVMQK